MEKTVQNWRHLNLNLIFLGAETPTVGVPQNLSPRLTGQVSLWRDPDIGTGTPRSERPFLVRLSQRRSCRRPSISGIRRLFSKTRDSEHAGARKIDCPEVPVIAAGEFRTMGVAACPGILDQKDSGASAAQHSGMLFAI